jgi:hypothetical protein
MKIKDTILIQPIIDTEGGNEGNGRSRVLLEKFYLSANQEIFLPLMYFNHSLPSPPRAVDI